MTAAEFVARPRSPITPYVSTLDTRTVLFARESRTQQPGFYLVNGETQEGIAMTQCSISGGFRMSTAKVYLDPARARLDDLGLIRYRGGLTVGTRREKACAFDASVAVAPDGLHLRRLRIVREVEGRQLVRRLRAQRQQREEDG